MMKPQDDLPDYVDREERIIAYKEIWPGLYCGVTSDNERFYLCDPPCALRLTDAARRLAMEIGGYLVFREGALGILVHELPIEAFLDYEDKIKLFLFFKSYVEHPRYFRERQIDMRLLYDDGKTMYDAMYGETAYPVKPSRMRERLTVIESTESKPLRKNKQR